jgi:glutamate-1-semialdehyde 2,1-aminomutase
MPSRLLTEYLRRTPNSARLFADARGVFPSGVTHDSRYLEPHPLFVVRAAGSRKWDVDGHEYVDYAGGHGALLLGHNHPEVTAAVSAQLSRGTHFGACHELEIEWGRLVQRLVPSAQRVRFTSSGTEATLLALRLARAHTARPNVLRFLTNFHGWQDHVAFGVGSHLDGTPTPGVLAEIAAHTRLAPPGDLEAVRKLLAAGDIAAVIIEPTGASWGQIPITREFLAGLREATAQHGAVLILDEVISGFRCSPGGAQQALGITPDLTTLAKIVAGGLPGGAVCGRKDLLDWLDHVAAPAAGHEKIAHHGTFNANPLSAAAGIAALRIVAETDACQRANDYAAQLREALGREVRDAGLAWCVYGTYSGFHIYTNPEREPVTADEIVAGRYDWKKLKAAAGQRELTGLLRMGMLTHGVEIFSWPGGPTSCVHTAEDLDRTTHAFRAVLRTLREEGRT